MTYYKIITLTFFGIVNLNSSFNDVFLEENFTSYYNYIIVYISFIR